MRVEALALCPARVHSFPDQRFYQGTDCQKRLTVSGQTSADSLVFQVAFAFANNDKFRRLEEVTECETPE